MHGVGVIGVLVKVAVLEGEVEMLWFQGVHPVEEWLAQVVQARHSLAILEGIFHSICHEEIVRKISSTRPQDLLNICCSVWFTLDL